MPDKRREIAASFHKERGQYGMDEDLIEQCIESEEIYKGNLLHVKRDRVKLPNGREAAREWVKHPGAAAVIPLLPDGQIVLVRQYRYPIQAVTLEIPAGKVDVPGEDPLGCAKRELQEETGYEAGRYEKLLTLATTVGFSDEWIHIYLATALSPGKQSPDEDEFIHVTAMPLPKAVQAVLDGRIVDSKTVAAVLLLARRESANGGGR